MAETNPYFQDDRNGLIRQKSYPQQE